MVKTTTSEVRGQGSLTSAPAREIATKVFNSYKEYCEELEYTPNLNGVSSEFAKQHPNFVEDNSTNKSCWNCISCTKCYDCHSCKECNECSYCTKCENCDHCSYCTECETCDHSYISNNCKNCFAISESSDLVNELDEIF